MRALRARGSGHGNLAPPAGSSEEGWSHAASSGSQGSTAHARSPLQAGPGPLASTHCVSAGPARALGQHSGLRPRCEGQHLHTT